MLSEEQDLHAKGLWHKNAFSSDIDPKYVPEENPKFSLPYYLIPESEGEFLSASNLDQRVRSQISTVVDGQTYYKLFVHPESEGHYEFLKGEFRYISAENSEHMASPTSSFRSLVVWDKYNMDKKPFIAKVSLDRNVIGSIDRLVSFNEVERSVANQNAFNKLGASFLEEADSVIFPETAGLTLETDLPGAPEKLGGQLIREIPDTVWKGERKWVAWASLISPERGPGVPPMLMDVIKQSGLDSVDFVEQFMIDNYMDMFERLSFKNGVNFEPHSQNLGFELEPNLKPTGRWVHKDFGGIIPDIVTMEQAGGPVEVYLDGGNAVKHKLKMGRSNAISSYVFFYKRQVFDFAMKEIQKYDPTFNDKKINRLKRQIDRRFLNMINTHMGLNLKEVPTMKNYKEIQKLADSRTRFKNKPHYTEIREGQDQAKQYKALKETRKEWVTLFTPKTDRPSRYIFADHGLYQVVGGRVAGFSLYNETEAAAVKGSKPDINKLLSLLGRNTGGCFSELADFLKAASRD
jgi:hypothetical protein